MDKIYLSFFLALFICFNVVAQSSKRLVTARVIDSKAEPVESATVSVILNGPDSSVVKSSATDNKGVFQIAGLVNGSYRIIISQIGLQNKVLNFAISNERPSVDFGTINMEARVYNLKEVAITAERAPVTIKKDTTEFNAGSFKTQKNDNVEELFKKLPGVDVDKDGKVTAQGKEVTKVLVDGKEFFGSDPKAVTKNLPADAIDKVQIIDDKTDKTKNTGIDDGQRDKVMNVTLKADKKKGWFGNMSVEGGNRQRYLGQFNMNHFDNKMQFSILSLSNNVNEAGFAYEDINNFAAGNAFGAFATADGSISINTDNKGRSNINGAFSGVDGGLVTNHTAGVNFTNEYGKKGQLKFNTSFITVMSNNNITQLSDLQDIPNNLYTNQFSHGSNTSNSYRLALNLEWKPDTLNTFRFKPNFGLGYKKNFSQSVSGTATKTTDSVNSINQLLNQTTKSPNVGGQLTFNHRLPNGNGSYNFYTVGNYSANNADYINQAATRYYVSGIANTNTNQQASQDNNASFVTTTVSFTTPLSKVHHFNLSLSQSVDLRKQNANQYTIDYNAVTGNYEIYNPLYSGNSDNRNHRYTSTVNLNKTIGFHIINLNLSVAQIGLHGVSISDGLNNDVSRSAWAFVPNASYSYRPKSGGSFNLNTGTNVALPSATDLQTVFNNINPLYIRQGNADLKQSRSFYTNFNYNYYDAKTSSYLNVYSNYNTTWNGFSTESSVTNGITTSKPINVDGNYSVNLGFNIGKTTPIKGLKYGLTSNTNLQHTVNFVNSNRNAVTRFAPGVGANTTIDREKYQFGLRFYSNYTNAKNSFQSLADRSYFIHSNTFNASFLPVKVWRIFSDINQTLYRGQPSSANTSVYLWNAGIERYFLKGQNLTVSLNAFDLLNQNSGIQRFISSTGVITNNQTNTIGQFFYLKFIYKITRLGAKSASPNNDGVVIIR